MLINMDFGSLVQIHKDDIYEHIYELYTEHRHAEGQHLGYVDKSQDVIEVSLPAARVDFTITQSLTALSSTVQTSSTGFICWQTASFFLDWILSDPRCPVRGFLSGKVGLELGAGVSSLLASALGPLASKYVATDQKHILRLLKRNFEDNVTTQRFTSRTLERPEAGPKRRHQPWPAIDFLELDWENNTRGIAEFRELTSAEYPDVVLACDTIYNSYLIPFFVDTLKATMGESTVAVVAMQLREQNVTEEFVEAVIDAELRLFAIPRESLSENLQKGFVVYCISGPEKRQQ